MQESEKHVQSWHKVHSGNHDQEVGHEQAYVDEFDSFPKPNKLPEKVEGYGYHEEHSIELLNFVILNAVNTRDDKSSNREDPYNLPLGDAVAVFLIGLL